MTNFPPIKNELRPRLKLKRHTDVPVTDEEIEANSRSIGQKWGAATSVPTAVAAPWAPEPPAISPAPDPARVISIRGYIPHYLDDELALKAVQRRVTKTFLIMEALEKAGYHVDEVDMVQDRRKRPKNI